MTIYMFLPSLLMLVMVVLQFDELQGQQSYVNNRQLDCEQNYTTALGFVCNGPPTNCISYLTFRSTVTYNSPVTIGYLLNADSSQIARINNISTHVDPIPINTLVIVPVNCSCVSRNGRTGFYQHNASYALERASETYFIVANDTYEGLSTCQAMIDQNPYNFRDLQPGLTLNVPLRCACPSPNQTAAGIRYLLTYSVTWGDSVSSIGDTFGVADIQSMYNANELSTESLIFPFTPILVPLTTEPININTSASPATPPRSPPEFPTVTVGDSSSSSRRWVFVGVGVGVGFLLFLFLSGFLFWFFRYHRRRRFPQGKPSLGGPPEINNKLAESSDGYMTLPENKSWSVTSEGVRYAIESLTLYRFEDLQKATGFFAKANLIKGSVYRGSFDGDDAAVKMIEGDVSGEINILKKINHSNIIRLSGFCVHEGNTYLVYEYTEKGSLADWLHHDRIKHKSYQEFTSSSTLSWKQRVRIAYDVADALNYLHNYTNPVYIHKNLKSSNILLDANMRAKVSNFGLAKTLEIDEEGEDGLKFMTRHVVGTYGYMAPEYIENGLVTPKLDVFAFGVVLLELLSGREATTRGGGDNNGDKGEVLLSAAIDEAIEGENVREKLRGFMDSWLGQEYPLDLAYTMAELAKKCVAHDLNCRPAMSEVFMTLSKILSSSLDWDPSHELQNTRSLSHGR